jgi:TetR/AcrR family transcriptional repressor of nem operon
MMAIGNAKDKLLDAGEGLLLSEGYARTTVDGVCSQAGVTKGSFYHYFKSKEELGIEVLIRWLTRTGQILTAGPHLEVADPVERVLVYVQHVADSTELLWEDGCLVGSLSTEMAGASERMQITVQAMFRGFEEQHAHLFAAVVKECVVPNPPSAQDLAELFLNSIEGAIVVGKAYRDGAGIRRAVLTFQHYLLTLLGRTASPS